jgi:hypothetical protein
LSLSNALLLLPVLVAVLVFGLLVLFGLLSMSWRHYTDRPWSERLRLLGHYLAFRLLAASFVGLAVLIVILASLTLNLNRAPAETTPSIQTRGVTGPVSVALDLDNCGDPVSARLNTRPPTNGPAFARVYSDDDGFQRVAIDRQGQGEFTFSDPSARRGILSCYLQLPLVSGNRGGYSIKLALSENLQVDTTESAPAPSGYFSGSWLWKCPAGQGCPSFAALEYDKEDGIKQLILLILAAVMGAIVAIFLSETLINGIRKRLSERSDD